MYTQVDMRLNIIKMQQVAAHNFQMFVKKRKLDS